MGTSLRFTNPSLEIRGLQLNPIYNIYGEIFWDWWRHLDFPHLPHSVWYRCLTVKGGDDIDKVTSYSRPQTSWSTTNKKFTFNKNWRFSHYLTYLLIFFHHLPFLSYFMKFLKVEVIFLLKFPLLLHPGMGHLRGSPAHWVSWGSELSPHNPLYQYLTSTIYPA